MPRPAAADSLAAVGMGAASCPLGLLLTSEPRAGGRREEDPIPGPAPTAPPAAGWEEAAEEREGLWPDRERAQRAPGKPVSRATSMHARPRLREEEERKGERAPKVDFWSPPPPPPFEPIPRRRCSEAHLFALQARVARTRRHRPRIHGSFPKYERVEFYRMHTRFNRGTCSSFPQRRISRS